MQSYLKYLDFSLPEFCVNLLFSWPQLKVHGSVKSMGLVSSGLLAANYLRAQNLEKLGLNADEAEIIHLQGFLQNWRTRQEGEVSVMFAFDSLYLYCIYLPQEIYRA